MTISVVDFGAFSNKHIYLIDKGVSSSDVMVEVVKRLTGRAALRIGIKKITKSGIVKYSEEFAHEVVDENLSTYRSGTTINGLIILTENASNQWYKAIVDAANATEEEEFHLEHVLTESAGVTMGLSDKKDYGSDLNMSGGYSVRANVLFKKSGDTATAVHLDSMTYSGQTIDPNDLKNQTAVLSFSFLTGLSSL